MGVGQLAWDLGLLRNGKDFHKELRAEGRKRILGNMESNNEEMEEGSTLRDVE